MLAAPPPTTAFGALLGHITGGADAKTFQPMNVNFGLFPELKGARGKDRKKAMAHRALADLDLWLGSRVGGGMIRCGRAAMRLNSAIWRR